MVNNSITNDRSNSYSGNKSVVIMTSNFSFIMPTPKF